MSVLVKGRKMPANCQECMCLNDEYFFCQAVVRKPEDQNFFEERPNWCPIIEIPDGHGRLIDADALMNDGWTLHKQVMRMDSCAIHVISLDNPNVPIVIPADKDGEA